MTTNQDTNQRLLHAVERALEAPLHDQDRILVEHCGGDQRLIGRARELFRQAALPSPMRVHAAPILDLAGVEGPLGDDPRRIEEILETYSELIETLERTRANYDRYRADSAGLLGSGAGGTVNSHFDRVLKRTVAVKQANARTDDSARSSRFIQEAQVLAQLSHPNIVPVFDMGMTEDGDLFFTMPLLSTSTLANSLGGKAKQGRELTSLVRQLSHVADALGYAHSRGVIHRDLKPANVVLDGQGAVYVADWGLSHIVGDAGSTELPPPSTDLREAKEAAAELRTRDGAIVGTPPYCAPELVRGGEGAPGTRSDVYSLGAMLYQALYGAPPYVDQAEETPSAAEIVQRMRAGDLEPPAQGAKRIPPALEAICQKAVHPDPGARYADARAMASDLSAYLDDRVVAAYRTGPLTELKQWVLRNKGLAASVVGGVALAIAIASVSAVLMAAKNRSLGRLSATTEATALQEGVEGLWPALPDTLPALRQWNQDTGELLADRPRHEAKLEELGSRSVPRVALGLVEHRERHPDFERVTRLGKEIVATRAFISAVQGQTMQEAAVLTEGQLSQDAASLGKQGRAATAVEGFRAGPIALALLNAAEARATPATPMATRFEIRKYRALALFECGQVEAMNAAFDAAEALGYPEAGDQLQQARAAVAAEIEKARSGAMSAQMDELERNTAALLSAIDASALAQFPSTATLDGWWYEQLGGLLEQLDALGVEPGGLSCPDAGAVVPGLGWSIPRRIAQAERLSLGFAADGDYSRVWKEHEAAIQAAHPWLTEPIVGLLPLGVDALSGNAEFCVLGTGKVPVRDDGGRLVLADDTAIVLIAIDGGRADLPRVDFDGVPFSHRVELAPYLISKYELTQAQWFTLDGTTPSYHSPQMALPQRPTPRHPVEEVTWVDVTRVLKRFQLAIPTVAQWEYAARAGSPHRWTAGPEPEDLEGMGNFLDAEYRRCVPSHPTDEIEWDDGYFATAPVGMFRPNAFGLHDVHGNVWEWCRDHEGVPVDRLVGPEGERQAKDHTTRSNRGGSFSGETGAQIFSNRNSRPEASSYGQLGVRPMMLYRPTDARAAD